MLKKILAVAVVLCAGLPVLANEKLPGPVIQTLDRHSDDVGCVYYFRNASISAYPVYISTPEGHWMNIDGEERALTSIESEGESNVGVFTAGDYRITIHYGRGKQREGGVNYPRAKMTVVHQARATKIKIKGGCGC